MIEINKSKLVPGITSTWGDIIGDITKQQDLVDYVETHGGGDAVWGDITGDISDQTDLNALLDNYAKKEWVENKGYITSDALSGYATETWVGNQGYLTSTDLDGYATQTWVGQQGYYSPDVAHDPVEYHNLAEDPDIEIEYQGYSPKTMKLIEPGENGFVIGRFYKGTDPTKENVDDIWGYYFGFDENNEPLAGKYEYGMYEKNGVIQPYESFQKLVVERDLNSYATKTWVSNKGYATQTWVGQQGYITSTALSGYATETWVGEQGFASASDLTSLASRVSTLETNYGDAITITNNILGV